MIQPVPTDELWTLFRNCWENLNMSKTTPLALFFFLFVKKIIKSLNIHTTSASAVEIIFHYSGALTYEFNSFLVTQTTHMFCKITASTNGLEMVNDIQLISWSHGRLLDMVISMVMSWSQCFRNCWSGRQQ